MMPKRKTFEHIGTSMEGKKGYVSADCAEFVLFGGFHESTNLNRYLQCLRQMKGGAELNGMDYLVAIVFFAIMHADWLEKLTTTPAMYRGLWLWPLKSGKNPVVNGDSKNFFDMATHSFRRVTAIYLNVIDTIYDDSFNYVLDKNEHKKKLDSFLKTAHENSMTVELALGDTTAKKWSLEGNYGLAKDILNAMLAYIASAPVKPVGIHLDVEFYAQDEWDELDLKKFPILKPTATLDDQRTVLLQQYLALVKWASDAVSKAGLKLSLAVPWWAYEQNTDEKPYIELEFQGVTDFLWRWMAKYADRLIVMGYFDNLELENYGTKEVPVWRKGILRTARAWIAPNQKYKNILSWNDATLGSPRLVTFGLETKYSGVPWEETFGVTDPPGSEHDVTGEGELVKAVTALRNEFKNNSAFGGVAIHHYEPWMVLQGKQAKQP